MAATLKQFAERIGELVDGGDLQKATELVREAYEPTILRRSLQDLIDVLEQISLDNQTVLAVVLLARVVEDAGSRTSIAQYLSRNLQSMPCVQLRCVPDYYTKIFHILSESWLESNDMKAVGDGAQLVLMAIEQFASAASCTMTSLHQALFALSLKSGLFDLPLKHVHIYPQQLAQEHPNARAVQNPRFVLQYFYYGGLLMARKARWADAASMFESAVSLPALALSAVALESLKKLVLVRALELVHESSELYYTKPVTLQLPSLHHMSALARAWKATSEVYVKLARAALDVPNSDRAARAELILRNAESVLKKDDNIQLARLLVEAAKDSVVRRYVNVFTTSTLPDLIERCHLRGSSEATEILDRLQRRGQIQYQISGGGDTVAVTIPSRPTSAIELKRALDELTSSGMTLQRVDDELRSSVQYLNALQSQQSVRFHGPSFVFQPHDPRSAGMGYIFEDEGLSLGGGALGGGSSEMAP